MSDNVWNQVIAVAVPILLAIVVLVLNKVKEIVANYMDRLAAIAEGKAAAEKLQSAVTNTVKAVEQITKGVDGVTGADKMTKTLTLLSAQDLDDLVPNKATAQTLIEAAVHDLKAPCVIEEKGGQ